MMQRIFKRMSAEFWMARVETALDSFLPDELTTPTRLHQAMRYGCLGGGKRIRAQLVYASGELFSAPLDQLDAAAAAVEMIHAYSLIHDDLPAMDNDALRRGRATTHIAFDDATAILAGDALQTLAIHCLTSIETSADTRIKLIRTLLQASGSLGMCGGQQIDMDSSDKILSLGELENLHALKTGALIRASVRMGALLGNASDDALNHLDQFANALGMAFQIRDDILDIEATTEQLGKTAGKDQAQAKSTYPALLGLTASKALLENYFAAMNQHLRMISGNTASLQRIAGFAVNRSH
jgi:farnesyl diphosphate synthase